MSTTQREVFKTKDLYQGLEWETRIGTVEFIPDIKTKWFVEVIPSYPWEDTYTYYGNSQQVVKWINKKIKEQTK